ncbi:odorant receptor 100, partial [Tribolium castaneum]
YSLLWPVENDELSPGIRYKLTILAFFSITGILVFSISVYSVLEIKQGYDIDVEDVAILIAVYGTYYMVSAYLNNQHQIALLERDLSQFYKFGKPPGFEQLNSQLNFAVKVLIIYSFLGTFVYNGTKMLLREECKKNSQEKGLSDNHCGLIATFMFPFRVDYFPVFYIVLVITFLLAHTLIKLCMHISFNAYEIVNHIVLRIEHLKEMILSCFNERNQTIVQKKLRVCILYHIEILDMAARLDKNFFNTMFGHFALTGAICACLEKQIVLGVNIVAGTLHFIGWIIALFVGCVAGQCLLNASEIIPNALWAAKWYHADLRTQKTLLFMLARSQKELTIKAGPFGILCFPLFVTVLKTSYSILCMLTS